MPASNISNTVLRHCRAPTGTHGCSRGGGAGRCAGQSSAADGAQMPAKSCKAVHSAGNEHQEQQTVSSMTGDYLMLGLVVVNCRAQAWEEGHR